MSSSIAWRKALDQIEALILNGRLIEAKEALDRLSPPGTADAGEQRAHANLRASLLITEGKYEEAKLLLERTLAELGPHIVAQLDLMVCQFHLQDMLNFRANLDKSELTLLQMENSLSARTLFESELLLGKFLEEEGRLAPALIYYERALSRTANNPTWRLRALIQKTRWRALYEPGAELSTLYRELISIPSSDLTKSLAIELQHSLMLIELRIIGTDHAWQRVERLGGDLPQADRRLLIYDFIEGSLTQDLAISSEIYKIAGGLENLDAFESYLLKLARGTMDSAAKIRELEQLATKLSWTPYLRLLCLTANQETGSTSTRQELNRKIQLIVLGLDSRSQAIWNQRLKEALQAPEIKAEISLRTRTLTVQGKTVDLSKKKIGLQLMAGLLGKKSLSVDQAIQLLWESSFTPEHYHRLRMSTHRLNTLIHEITGLGKILEVDSQSVRLRPEVRLKSSDDVLDVLRVDWPTIDA